MFPLLANLKILLYCLECVRNSIILGDKKNNAYCKLFSLGNSHTMLLYSLLHMFSVQNVVLRDVLRNRIPTFHKRTHLTWRLAQPSFQKDELHVASPHPHPGRDELHVQWHVLGPTRSQLPRADSLISYYSLGIVSWGSQWKYIPIIIIIPKQVLLYPGGALLLISNCCQHVCIFLD